MPAWREKASATVSRSGSAKGSASRPRKAKVFVAGALGGQREQRRAVVHQALIGLAGAVPFEHGEFRMVQRAALAVAIDRAEAEDARFAGGEQLLAGEFRRGVQIERRARARRAGSPRWRRPTDASRCRARPAGRLSRPRRNRAGRTSRGSPRRWRCAGSAAAAGRRVMGRPPGRGSRHRVSGPCCSVALPPPLPSPR